MNRNDNSNTNRLMGGKVPALAHLLSRTRCADTLGASCRRATTQEEGPLALASTASSCAGRPACRLRPSDASAQVNLHLVIPGPPQAQQRARIARTRVGPRMMDPPKSRSWKATAQAHMADSVVRELGRLAPFEPDTQLEVVMLAVFPCPTTDHRKREPRPRRWHTKAAGDADNLAKAVLDASNGVLWLDDRQVARLVVEKIVGAQGEAPRVALEVRVLGEATP